LDALFARAFSAKGFLGTTQGCYEDFYSFVVMGTMVALLF